MTGKLFCSWKNWSKQVMYKHLKETKEFSNSQCDLNSSTSSNDFDINVYNEFIKKPGKSVFSETTVQPVQH